MRFSHWAFEMIGPKLSYEGNNWSVWSKARRLRWSLALIYPWNWGANFGVYLVLSSHIEWRILL